MVSGWRNPTPFNTFPTMYDQIPELQTGTLIIRFMWTMNENAEALNLQVEREEKPKRD